MSTVKATYLQHPSATSENITLNSDGSVDATVNGYAAEPLIALGRWTTETVNYSATWSKRSVFDTVNVDINRTGFTVETDGVTVPANGIYRVTYNIGFTSAVARSAPAAAVGVNDSVNFPGATASIYSFTGYMRNVDNHNTSTSNISGLVELTSGDKINVFVYQDGLTGDVTFYTAGQWAIERIAE